jgi:hypothetical protein
MYHNAYGSAIYDIILTYTEIVIFVSFMMGFN